MANERIDAAARAWVGTKSDGTHPWDAPDAEVDAFRTHALKRMELALAAADAVEESELAATRSALRQLLAAAEDSSPHGMYDDICVMCRAVRAARVLVSDVSTQDAKKGYAAPSDHDGRIEAVADALYDYRIGATTNLEMATIAVRTLDRLAAPDLPSVSDEHRDLAEAVIRGVERGVWNPTDATKRALANLMRGYLNLTARADVSGTCGLTNPTQPETMGL